MHEPVVLDAWMGYGDDRKVAISTNGAAIAAWGHFDPAWPREPNGLWFSRREPGAAAWTAPTYLDVGEGEYLVEGLQLAVDAAGKMQPLPFGKATATAGWPVSRPSASRSPGDTVGAPLVAGTDVAA